MKLVIIFLDSSIPKLKHGGCNELIKTVEDLETELELKVFNIIDEYDQELENEENENQESKSTLIIQWHDFKK